jgi:hypothetical protein
MTPEVTQVIRSLRATVPACNLDHFDASAESLVQELSSRPGHRQELTAWFWDRVQVLRVSDVSMTPPALAKRQGENNTAWLDRCYLAAGFLIGGLKCNR